MAPLAALGFFTPVYYFMNKSKISLNLYNDIFFFLTIRFYHDQKKREARSFNITNEANTGQQHFVLNHKFERRKNS